MPAYRAYKSRGSVRGSYGARYTRPAQRSFAQTQARRYRGVARSRGPIVATAGEMKYFDAERPETAIVSSPTFAGCEMDPTVTTRQGIANPNTLFAPSQGNGIDQQNGRRSELYKIKIRGTIRVPAQAAQTTGDASCRVRLMLVWDKQTNFAQLNSEDVINDPNTNTALMSTQAFQNLDNLGRFVVLKDKVITLANPNSINTTAQQGMIRSFKMMINFKKPIKVRTDSAGNGNVTDIVDNSFHIIANCDNTELAPTISYYSRCAFKDQ